jgi:hypothetical protein
LAREDGRGKKGKCPKCGHDLVVPKTTAGRPAISVDKESLSKHTNPPAKKHALEGANMPQHTPNHDTFEIPDDITEVYEENPGFLIPTYDELSLFLMAVTFIILYFTNGKIRTDITWFLMGLDIWRRYIYVGLFLASILLCLYHVFTSRKKTDFEKGIMLLLAVTVNAATGIVAGIYMIKESPGWLLLFPIWNIINGALLILMLRCNIIDEQCIADRDATAIQIILGLIAVLVIFAFCNYVFKLHWAITFSICIIYATSFDKAVQSVFPGLAIEDEQAP